MHGKVIETCRASELLAFRGLDRVPVEEARAGDIVAIAGLAHATVANTVADPTVSDPIPAQPIDPPPLSMSLAVNDSPLAGRAGSKVTRRQIRYRLLSQTDATVTTPLTPTPHPNSY